MKLKKDFYQRNDVVAIARNLLGKTLATKINGDLTSGLIVETEAYAGESDKASHAYGGRNTKRTAIMYQKGGIAYVYLCYGIHSMFNVVTNDEGIPHAVLIRGIIPLEGKDIMLERSKKSIIDKCFGSGPGKVSRILGIHHSMTGEDLLGENIWIEDKEIIVDNRDIEITPRIGIDYAGKDASLPYRFLLASPDKYI